jgi:cell division protein FtsQ
LTDQDLREQESAGGTGPEAYPTQGTVRVVRHRGKRSRRTRKPRLARWQKAALAGGGLALVLVGGVGMSMQSPMPIGSVVIVGGSPDLQPQIASAAAAAPGQSFASVDAGAARERIVAIEGIESADLRWSWWNTLTVEVLEQTPVGLQPAPAGGFVVLDSAGEQIRTASERPAGMVLIEAGTADGRAAALHVAQNLPTDLRALTDAVIGSSAESVSLRMASGATVVLGSTQDLPQKFLLASQLLAGTGASTVNVSVPQRPAVAGIPEPPKP